MRALELARRKRWGRQRTRETTGERSCCDLNKSTLRLFLKNKFFVLHGCLRPGRRRRPVLRPADALAPAAAVAPAAAATRCITSSATAATALRKTSWSGHHPGAGGSAGRGAPTRRNRRRSVGSGGSCIHGRPGPRVPVASLRGRGPPGPARRSEVPETPIGRPPRVPDDTAKQESRRTFEVKGRP